jgi:dephospho-CoA kinase
VHALYAAGGAAVASVERAFPGCTDAGGGVDRGALSAAVAARGREESLRRLEAIVHPFVTQSRRTFVENAATAGEWMVVVDVPLLFETLTDAAELRSEVDLVLVVSASPEIQRARVLARPEMTEAKLEAILARQLPDATKRARADVVIDTSAESLSPARAQLARFVDSAAAAHGERWSRWLQGGLVPHGAASRAWPAVWCVTLDLDDTCWPVMAPLRHAAKARSPAARPPPRFSRPASLLVARSAASRRIGARGGGRPRAAARARRRRREPAGAARANGRDWRGAAPRTAGDECRRVP